MGNFRNRQLVTNALFRPVCIVVIDRLHGAPTRKKVYLRLQAGEYPAPSEETKQLKPGDLLTPVLLYFGRSKGKSYERDVARRQPFPWTYLMVEEVDRGRVTCRPFSTFRAPIHKPQTKILTMALRVRPVYSKTSIQLVRRKTNDGIGSLVVRIATWNAITQDYDIKYSLTSDREGWVTIPASTEGSSQLRRLYIVSGESLLGRVPYVPGRTFKGYTQSSR